METRAGDGSHPTRRQQVIERLCEAFAEDRIDLPELERRLEAANRVHTEGEFRQLLAGLEGPLRPSGESGSPMAPAERGMGGYRDPGRPWGPDSVSPALDPARIPERQFTVAVWSGRSRRGVWVPARQITAFALMGGVELDFREAPLPSGETRIHAVAVMGAVEITVPPGVHVDTSGFAVMGAFEDDAEGGSLPHPAAPVLKVTGFALMGGVEVRVRLPGETERDARRRKKEERRRLRDARRS